MDEFDLVGYLNNKGIGPLRQAPAGNIHAPCFWCDEPSNKAGRLYILNEPPYPFMCFLCGIKGALPKLLAFFGDELAREDAHSEDFVSQKILQVAAKLAHERLTDPDNNPIGTLAATWLVHDRGVQPEVVSSLLLGYADGTLGSRLREAGFSAQDIQRTGLMDRNGRDFFQNHITIPYLVSGNVVLIRGRKFPDSKSGPKYTNPSGAKPRLYGTDCIWRLSPELVIVTEGEFDAIILQQLGYAAVAVPGAQVWPDSWNSYFDDCKRVFIVFDADSAGVAGAEKLKQKIGPKAKIVQLPGVGTDVSDWVVGQHHSRDDFDALLNLTATKTPFIRASSIKTRDVEFFWNNRIPLGKLTVAAGMGGVGKSYLSLALTAAITAGVPLLDDGGQKLDGEVLMLSYEDDHEDTLVPRALNMGVNTDRLHLLRPLLKTESGGLRPFDPQDVREYIEEPLLEHPEIRLVVIDPLGSFYPADMDGNAENAVRGALASLVIAARKTRTAVLVVAHHRKEMSGSAQHQIAGSQAVSAFARSVLTVGLKDGKQYIAHAKHNLSAAAPTLSYYVEKGKFRWGEIVPDLTANQLVDPRATHKALARFEGRPGYLDIEEVNSVETLTRYMAQCGCPVKYDSKTKDAVASFLHKNPGANWQSILTIFNYVLKKREKHPTTMAGVFKYAVEAKLRGWIDDDWIPILDT